MLRTLQFDLIVSLHKRKKASKTGKDEDKSFVFGLIGGEKTKAYRAHKLTHACADSITPHFSAHTYMQVQLSID